MKFCLVNIRCSGIFWQCKNTDKKHFSTTVLGCVLVTGTGTISKIFRDEKVVKLNKKISIPGYRKRNKKLSKNV
jgi:hypothetical protein